MPIPYRIETPRLVIRCYHPSDAPLLKSAVDASLEHIRPWLPWAAYEPTDIHAKVHRLRQFRGNFDLDKDYTYGIFSADESRLLGGTGLHTRRGPDAFEIGYWIHADEIGKGYARETAAALTRTAFEIVGVARMEIRCDPANVASLAVPRRLGYKHTETLQDIDKTSSGEPRGTMVWEMNREAFARLGPSQSGQAELWPPIRCYDATGAALV